MAALTFIKMDAPRCRDAFGLLNAFLREDQHYLASSISYGDEGAPALHRALGMFLQRSELGFVWLAYKDNKAVGVCVVSYAISTSIGGIVAKLDDVFVALGQQRQGLATAMIQALAVERAQQAKRWLFLCSYEIDRRRIRDKPSSRERR